jgi:hypothetical protein
MDTQQQIAGLKEALAALDAAIAQTQATLALATTQQDIASLQSSLVELRSERARTQSLLDSLESSAVVVAALAASPLTVGPATAMIAAPRARGGMSAGEMRTLRKDLKTAHAAAPLVKATLGFAGDVTRIARDLRMGTSRTILHVGDDPTVPTGRPRPRAARTVVAARLGDTLKRRG